jgi:hypothetical protein
MNREENCPDCGTGIGEPHKLGEQVRFRIDELNDGVRISTGDGRVIAVCPNRRIAESVAVAMLFFQKNMAVKEVSQ